MWSNIQGFLSLQEILKTQDEDAVLVVVWRHSIEGHDDFSECVVDFQQWAHLLFALLVIGNLVGGLDIVAAMPLVGHEIDFKHLP